MKFATLFLAFASLVLGQGSGEEGKVLMERICTKCHNLISTKSQRNSRETWQKIVDDMIARGAEGTDAEFDKIVDYLARTQGPKAKIYAGKSTSSCIR